jgi:hypothetical protein
VLEKGQSDLETAIVDAKDGIVTTKAEIEALDDVIKAALETKAQPDAHPPGFNETNYLAIIIAEIIGNACCSCHKRQSVLVIGPL